jgi:hypothetical protein
MTRLLRGTCVINLQFRSVSIKHSLDQGGQGDV